jgi:hypothetical protein
LGLERPVSIPHSGGMCDADDFHEKIDEMTAEVQRDIPDISAELARDSVLMTVLWLIEPAGRA